MTELCSYELCNLIHLQRLIVNNVIFFFSILKILVVPTLNFLCLV